MPNLTLLDWTKRADPDGTPAMIANILAQTNSILMDQVSLPGNLPTGHRVTVATGLPTISARAMNEGVLTTKATTSQTDETMAMFEDFSEIDVALAKLNGNDATFLLNESRLHLEAMNQKVATDLFYGNPAVDPKTFLGLAPRYSSTLSGNAQNIILGGGTTPNIQTSVWLICWADSTVFAIHPKGNDVGLVHDDLGEDVSYDAGGTGRRMKVFVNHFKWYTGLAIRDWRYACRIANLEVGGATNDLARLAGIYLPSGSTPQTGNLLHLMGKAVARIPNMQIGRCAWYMNRTVFSALMRLALESGVNSGLMINTAAAEFGTPSQMLRFLGIPIRQCDAILNTEAVVV